MTEKTSQDYQVQKPLVMIIDDVAQNLQVLGNMLKSRGYNISAATGGKQALTMLEKIAPDLILLDIMMPEIDGFQVCQQLKEMEKTKDIPVIFLTARSQTEDIVKGFGLGAVDYVTKPFQKAELLARVHTHLELKRARDNIVRLEQKNTALAMAVTANHQINQPLTILQGNFDLLRQLIDQPGAPSKQGQYMLKMQESIKRIQEILDQFMNSSSIHFEEYIGNKKQVVFDKQ